MTIRDNSPKGDTRSWNAGTRRSVCNTFRSSEINEADDWRHRQLSLASRCPWRPQQVGLGRSTVRTLIERAGPSLILIELGRRQVHARRQETNVCDSRLLVLYSIIGRARGHRCG